MAERFNAPVLKTGGANNSREFESLSFRHARQETLSCEYKRMHTVSLKHHCFRLFYSVSLEVVWFFLDTYRVQTMHITHEMRQQACEGLFSSIPAFIHIGVYGSVRNLIGGDMTSAQLNKLLKAHGWVQRSQAGSHITFKNGGVPHLITVTHPRRDLKICILNDSKNAGV